MGPGVGNESKGGIGTSANQYRSASARALSREWSALEHGSVCQGLWLQKGRRDGPRAALQDLVATPQCTGNRTTPPAQFQARRSSYPYPVGCASVIAGFTSPDSNLRTSRDV